MQLEIVKRIWSMAVAKPKHLQQDHDEECRIHKNALNFYLHANLMTCKDLSEKLFVSSSVVSRWKVGRIKIPEYRLKEIANVFNITVSDFLATGADICIVVNDLFATETNGGEYNA